MADNDLPEGLLVSCISGVSVALESKNGLRLSVDAKGSAKVGNDGEAALLTYRRMTVCLPYCSTTDGTLLADLQSWAAVERTTACTETVWNWE